jgi:hypothetical protein
VEVVGIEGPVPSLKIDRSTSWALFHEEFVAMVDHNNYAACGKARHLLAILQGKMQTSYMVSQQKQHTEMSVGC